MTEFYYVSEMNKSWECVICKKEIPSEDFGPYYTPASRYWIPGSKVGTTYGVFCSAECANPRANNENPVGL